MSKVNKLSANMDLYAQIERIPMDESERARALVTLRRADAVVDGIVRAINGIKRLL